MLEYFRVASLLDGEYHQTLSGDVKTQQAAEGDAIDYLRRAHLPSVGVWQVQFPPGIPQLLKEIRK